MKVGIPTGGYCPKGRKAEDGCIPELYLLEELESAEYTVRTEKNVMESDATLILNKHQLTEGTKATFNYTLKHSKPCLIVQLEPEQIMDPTHVVQWIHRQQIQIINIAGPRESKFPTGIYNQALVYLEQIFTLLKETR